MGSRKAVNAQNDSAFGFFRSLLNQGAGVLLHFIERLQESTSLFSPMSMFCAVKPGLTQLVILRVIILAIIVEAGEHGLETTQVEAPRGRVPC
jgi:hypothetical protein